MWREYWNFFREFRRDFHHTGAILPSGGALARALALSLRGRNQPWRILEVGPGSGSVTRAIARAMLPEDHLDAVEINTAFAEQLARRIATDPAFGGRRKRITVLCAPVQQVPGDGIYDAIVSGLPLNNFAPEDITSIFATFSRLLRPGGILSYFEYQYIRSLKIPFVGPAERQRLKQIGRILDQYLRDHQVSATNVLWNMPPAIVRYLKLRA